MNKQKILDFAKQNGYSTIQRVEDWKGYEIYEPVFNKPTIIGLPFVIMVKKDKIRMSTPKEAMARLKSLPNEYDEDN